MLHKYESILSKNNRITYTNNKQFPLKDESNPPIRTDVWDHFIFLLIFDWASDPQLTYGKRM